MTNTITRDLLARTKGITASPDGADDRDHPHYVPAPCQVACPVGTDVPSYLAAIWDGDYEGAFEAIHATNPLSSICGRVCDAPCEPACRRADSDGPVAIRHLKRFVLDKLGDGHALPPVPVTRAESIAVVGGGPAGMTAAQDLAEAGFKVDLYEASDRLGGMAVWGIPRFRLPEGIIAQDVDRLLAHCPGLTVHTNTALGRDVTLDELRGRHNAVVLTIGATWGKGLGLPGDDHPQVVDGVGFLRRVNAGERPTLPETVLVVGGGDVAMDACRVAKRMPGVRTVKVLYRRGPAQMPARRDELKGALAEDIEIVYHIQPTAVVTGDDGALALRCVRTELGEPDRDGRRRPVAIPGSEEDIPCGMVIAAVGQKAACEDLDGLGLMDADRVRTDWATMATGMDGVFAAGDGAFGGSSIVEAMHHGHRVAYYVTAHLDGRTDVAPYRTPMKTRERPMAQDPMWEINPRQEADFRGIGVDPLAFAEVEAGYTDDQAKAEAARCFRCDIETGSADYTVHAREALFDMARLPVGESERYAETLAPRLIPRADPFAGATGGRLDELTFLPANLSRLVIDPYREHCKTATDLAGLRMDGPVALFGLDDAPDFIRDAASKVFETRKGAVLGAKPLDGAAWIQLIEDQAPDPKADAVIRMTPNLDAPPPDLKTPQGIRVTRETVEAAVDYALAHDLDLLLLDGTGGGTLASELAGAPDLSLLALTVRAMRARNAEEAIPLLWFGGVRTGTDVAKLKSMGADAAVIGAAFAFALEGRPNTEASGFLYPADLDAEEREGIVARLFQALDAEVSMMAKCTGKTSIHNLEPEDLRAITQATAEATGIPLPGRALRVS
jgi:NADPH-dependent glutamate synthase beta subunit-like oxidoreductase